MRPIVVVPTFNERDNLPVIAAALLQLHDLRMLVVDDGSPDGTGVVADTLAAAQPWTRCGPASHGHRAAWVLSYIDGMQLRAAHRRDAHLPDGRGPLARSSRCPASARGKRERGCS